ncbi:MAG: hypothetical protein QGH11_12205, partial [Pirellulaceae bacterium]|nr:hypothetical protein [Pirellulaceae bacterium]
TFAELADYSQPLPDDIDGGSLRSILHGNGDGAVERPRPFLVFHQGVNRNPISSIRVGDYKLVKTWSRNRLELFDLSKDLSEAEDLSGRQQERTRQLDALLTEFLEEVGAETRRTKK